MPIDINNVVLTGGTNTFEVSKPGASWLRIDSTGRVTKDQMPFMAAQFSGQGSFMRGHPLKFNSIDQWPVTNPCWNNTTGYWTCPIAGRYLVHMSGIATSGTGYFSFVKNGSYQQYSHWNHTTAWVPCSLTGVVTCAAGDTISFDISTLINPGTASPGWYAGGAHGSFMIALTK